MKPLQEIVRRVLLYEWDPIGVSEYPEAADEYDSYVLPVCGLLIHGATANEVFEYLWHLETEHIGVPGNADKTRKIAERLVQLEHELPG